jgi:hypothetical protein
VDPDTVELDPTTAISRKRQTAGGGDRRTPARPGRQLDDVVGGGRREDVDPDAAYDPEMLRRAPPRLVDVVTRDVL